MEELLRLKNRSAFTASVINGKNSKFLAINHEDVPCDPASFGGKARPIKFTVLRPLSAGFSSVPFKQGAPPANTVTKKLAELGTKTNEVGIKQPTMQMWSFAKAKTNTDKGPRNDDVSWQIEAGMTFTMWLDEDLVCKATKVFSTP